MDALFFTIYNKDAFEANKREFSQFLSFDFNEGKYGDKIQRMLDDGEKRLIINIDDLREYSPNLAKSLLKKPGEFLPAIEQALRDEVARLLQSRDTPENNNNASKEDILAEYTIGLEGHFGAHEITPRELTASNIGQLMLVEGIVTKLSLVRPKVVKSVHYCKATGEQHVRYYRDSTSTVGIPSSTTYPTKDDQGNPLSTEYGLSVYKDHQTMTIQEMPEKAPPGQLPCSVDVTVEDDLVDLVKPGDRVQVCGIYKGLPHKHGGQTSAIFRTIIIANNIRLFAKEVKITEKDIENIKKVSKDPQIFDKMSQSLAPSIFGHDFIKKALLLQLLGGVEKNLENKTHLRGDINVMLIGDPSTAKSQLLRFVLHTAPLAINTTGRGASGVGLTAAIVTDGETGERRLEAGAMVLADGGIVCIDEFDKMSVDDRVAIHEVMEQQTVTIAKAGIHTTLNARCSVLAAANPIYGQYNRSKKPTENIALPDSLLSRFDLLFIFLDQLNPESDRQISDHVLRMHRYKHANDTGEEGLALSLATELSDKDNWEQEQETPLYQKYDKLLHGKRKKQEIFSIAFIKKYLLYARFRIKPKLSEAASAYINNAYANLRSKDDMKTLPITVRSLETMIRLATAHAKSRLAMEVTEEDAKVAVEIMNFALYHETANQAIHGSDAAPTDQPQPSNGVNNNNNSRDDRPSKKQKTAASLTSSTTLNDDEDAMDLQPPTSTQSQDDEPPLISKQRKEMFQKKVAAFFRGRHGSDAEVSSFDELLTALNADKTLKDKFTQQEAKIILNEMQEASKILFADNQIHLL